MLLILTNDADATANYLVPVLVDHQVPFVRLDTNCLTGRTHLSYRCGEPALIIGGDRYTPTQFSNVWFRRPERLADPRLTGTPEGRYALDEWAEALEGFLAHIPPCKWMNCPVSNAAASHKMEQLTTARDLGLEVPDTLVTQEPEALRQFFALHKGRVIVKPMAGGYVKRQPDETDSLIYTNPLRSADLENLDDLTLCPTLFQPFIDKSYDVRITVVDKDIHAVEIHVTEDDGSQRCDVRRNNMVGATYRQIALPLNVTSGIYSLVSHYGLRFAAIDMAVGRDGTWYFLEVNPNGQWAWLDLTAGTAICNSFVRSFRE